MYPNMLLCLGMTVAFKTWRTAWLGKAYLPGSLFLPRAHSLRHYMMLWSNLRQLDFPLLVFKLPFLPGCSKDDLLVKFYNFTRVYFDCALLFSRFNTFYFRKLSCTIEIKTKISQTKFLLIFVFHFILCLLLFVLFSAKFVQIGALVNENKQNPLVCNACNLCGVNTHTVLLLLVFFVLYWNIASWTMLWQF